MKAMSGAAHSPWMAVTLRGAAIYSLLSGVLLFLFPGLIQPLLGMPPIPGGNLLSLVGAIAAIYGLGYLIAANDPYRHWPVVLVGLLLKTLLPIYFLRAASTGHLPWAAGWTTLVNDLIWWIPFGLILRGAYEAQAQDRRRSAPEIQRMALRARTQFGATIGDLSRDAPVLLVFLRHSGCPFCREALSDLSRQRAAIEAMQTRIVIVHMGPEEHAVEFFRRYGLEGLPRVSDEKRALYEAFGLGRAGFLKLLGPAVWRRAIHAALIQRHGFGGAVGDGFQMPGAFLVFHEQVIRGYRHQSTADRPNYLQLAGDEQLLPQPSQ